MKTYVRAYKRIYELESEDDYTYLSDKFYNLVEKESFNLKDIIEVKDIVNGHKVISIEDGKIYVLLDSGLISEILEDEIETITPHELYEEGTWRRKNEFE